MENLIKVAYNNDRITVLARDLHEFLEINTQYTKWFDRMCEYGFDENVDYQAISQKRLTAQGNETSYVDHQITIEMAKEISMLQRNEKGKQARQYFIRCEKQLKKPQVNIDKQKEIDAKYMNAKARVASIWLKIAEKVPSNKEYQQICGAYASEALTGQKVLPLPQSNEKHYNATEVGAILGITANAVGRLANKYNLKTNENGKLFFDKSKSSNKEVEIFKYNENGIEAIRKVMGGKK